jgi:hypothetical protein
MGPGFAPVLGPADRRQRMGPDQKISVAAGAGLLMLRFTGVMKLADRVRSGVDLFASNHAGHHHSQEGDPDHDTANFKHAAPRQSDPFAIGRRIAGEGSKFRRRRTRLALLASPSGRSAQQGHSTTKNPAAKPGGSHTIRLHQCKCGERIWDIKAASVGRLFPFARPCLCLAGRLRRVDWRRT